MRDPKVRVRRRPATLTITIDENWSTSRDWFRLVADAIKAEAWELSDSNHEDACYLEIIADTISKAVRRADDNEQRDIANIFG